jgi:predicted enzyme related to lactoylglutathione lyase
MDYTLVTTTPLDDQQRGPRDPGAINGGMMKRSSDVAAPVITIEVASIDDALAKIEGAGGSTVQPRQEIPGMGAFAYFTDCEGNVLGLWETMPSS